MNINQAAQGIPGPHSYINPTGRLAQVILPKDEESEHTARPQRRVYALAEAEYQRLVEANRIRRARQAVENYRQFGAGIHLIEQMMSQLALGEGRARAYTPSDGDEDDGTHGTLAERAMGDWSWKPNGWPHRREDQLACSQDGFVTFTGVPCGAAELYGRRSYHRA